jgi:hypothetical protein
MFLYIYFSSIIEWVFLARQKENPGWGLSSLYLEDNSCLTHFANKDPDQPEASREEGQGCIKDEFAKSVVHNVSLLGFIISDVIAAMSFQNFPPGIFSEQKNMKGRFRDPPYLGLLRACHLGLITKLSAFEVMMSMRSCLRIIRIPRRFPAMTAIVSFFTPEGLSPFRS